MVTREIEIPTIDFSMPDNMINGHALLTIEKFAWKSWHFVAVAFATPFNNGVAAATADNHLDTFMGATILLFAANY